MSKLDITIYDLFGEKGDSAYVLVDIKKINEYINLAKALEAEHEALKKDVARYFELKQGIPPLEDEMNYQFAQKYKLENEPKDECYFRISNEYYRLEEKLSKVGKE